MVFNKLIGYNTEQFFVLFSPFLEYYVTRPFDLTAAERAALTEVRDTAPQAYLRERAAALLKVADGMPAARVAQQGVLRPRQPDTVYRWMDRFIDHGIDGLRIRTGRGRKPAFFPWRASLAAARDDLLHLVQRTPRACGIERTRWTLATLQRACGWLTGVSLPGVHGVLRRLGIPWKRGRQAVRSPDPNYHPKRDDIAQALAQAQTAPDQHVTL
jgi:transposase